MEGKLDNMFKFDNGDTCVRNSNDIFGKLTFTDDLNEKEEEEVRAQFV